MSTLLPVIISAVVAAWAMLTVMGGERERQIQQLPPPAPKDPPAPSASVPAKPAMKAPGASKAPH